MLNCKIMLLTLTDYTIATLLPEQSGSSAGSSFAPYLVLDSCMLFGIRRFSETTQQHQSRCAENEPLSETTTKYYCVVIERYICLF